MFEFCYNSVFFSCFSLFVSLRLLTKIEKKKNPKAEFNNVTIKVNSFTLWTQNFKKKSESEKEPYRWGCLRAYNRVKLVTTVGLAVERVKQYVWVKILRPSSATVLWTLSSQNPCRGYANVQVKSLNKNHLQDVIQSEQISPKYACVWRKSNDAC